MQTNMERAVFLCVFSYNPKRNLNNFIPRTYEEHLAIMNTVIIAGQRILFLATITKTKT